MQTQSKYRSQTRRREADRVETFRVISSVHGNKHLRTSRSRAEDTRSGPQVFHGCPPSRQRSTGGSSRTHSGPRPKAPAWDGRTGRHTYGKGRGTGLEPGNSNQRANTKPNTRWRGEARKLSNCSRKAMRPETPSRLQRSRQGPGSHAARRGERPQLPGPPPSPVHPAQGVRPIPPGDSPDSLPT